MTLSWAAAFPVVVIRDKCPRCGAAVGTAETSGGCPPVPEECILRQEGFDPLWDNRGGMARWNECENRHKVNVRAYHANGNFMFHRYLQDEITAIEGYLVSLRAAQACVPEASNIADP